MTLLLTINVHTDLSKFTWTTFEQLIDKRKRKFEEICKTLENVILCCDGNVRVAPMSFDMMVYCVICTLTTVPPLYCTHLIYKKERPHMI